MPLVRLLKISTMKQVPVMAVWLLVAALFVAGTIENEKTPVGMKCAQKCDTYAECVEVAEGNFTCVCKTGFIGDGLPSRCHDLKEVVKANCRYQSLPLRYEHVISESKQVQPENNSKTCDKLRILEAYIRDDVFEMDYLGDKLTSGDCATVLEVDILCPDKMAIPAPEVSQSKNPLVKEGATVEAAVEAASVKIVHLVKLLDFQSLNKMALGHEEWKYFKKDPLGCLFNIARGIPQATRIWMTSEEVKQMGSFLRSVVSNQFYKEPDLSFQGSYELYDQSGWDRGHIIPPQLASFDSWALHNTFSYAFTVPQARKFNRVYWLEVEHELMEHLESAFTDSNGEFAIFAGTSSKEIRIYDAPNGGKEFDLVEGEVRSLKGNITIPNSIWSLAIFVHVDPKTNEINQVEGIAHMGNNYDEPMKAVILSVPLQVMEAVTGFKWHDMPSNAKQIQTHLTKTMPFKGDLSKINPTV